MTLLHSLQQGARNTRGATLGGHSERPIIREALHVPAQPLESAMHSFSEPWLAYDFSALSVHADGRGPSALTPLHPDWSEILQRKCTCGGTPGPTGECEECLKKRLALQTKLKVNEPGDIYEQEADRIADQILSTPARHAVRDAPPRIQRFSAQSGGQLHAPPSVFHALNSPGRPLEPALRRDMEQRFGYDFSRVRVHSGAVAEQSARDVNAQAYTVGYNIVFGAGRYAPETHHGRRLLAHELTHCIQQNSRPDATRIDPVPVRAFSTVPVLARACDAVKCPVVEFPLGAFTPSWQLAESCLQDQYKKSFPNSTVGFNKHWVGLIGKNPREQATIDCFRSHYSAKGFESDEARRRRGSQRDIPVERQGSAQPQAEPDIFDFTNLKIMEITTPSGVPYRSMKIDWEVDEATKLMHACNIGGRNQWSTGFWEPEPCYQVIGAGPSLAGKLFFRTWRIGGILVYVPVLDITREALAAAVAAAAAAAAASAAGMGGAAGAPARATTGPRWSLEISKTTAAIIAGLAALATLVATVFKPVRIGMLLGELLGALLKWLGFALAFAGGAAAAASRDSSDKESHSSGTRHDSSQKDMHTGPATPSAGSKVTIPGSGSSAGDSTRVAPDGSPTGGSGTVAIPVPRGAPPAGSVPPPAKIAPPPPPTTAPQGSAGQSSAHGTRLPPEKITVPKAGEAPSAPGASGKKSTGPSKPSGTSAQGSGVASKTQARGQTIDLVVIEGLNLASVSKGMLFFIRLAQENESNPKGIDPFMLFQVVEKRTQGRETTVEFKALMECNEDKGCIWTGSIYRVTHPSRSVESRGLFAYADPNMHYPEWAASKLLEAAAMLERQGHFMEAGQVRQEGQRVLRLTGLEHRQP
jgi:hypothetical protein